MITIQSKAELKFPIDDPRKPLEVRFAERPNGDITMFIRTDHMIKNSIPSEPVMLYHWGYVGSRLARKLIKMKEQKI